MTGAAALLAASVHAHRSDERQQDRLPDAVRRKPEAPTASRCSDSGHRSEGSRLSTLRHLLARDAGRGGCTDSSSPSAAGVLRRRILFTDRPPRSSTSSSARRRASPPWRRLPSATPIHQYPRPPTPASTGGETTGAGTPSHRRRPEGRLGNAVDGAASTHADAGASDGSAARRAVSLKALAAQRFLLDAKQPADRIVELDRPPAPSAG